MEASSDNRKLTWRLLSAAVVLCILGGGTFWFLRQRGTTAPREDSESFSPKPLLFVVRGDKDHWEFPAGESATAMKAWVDGILSRPAGPAAPGPHDPWFPEYMIWSHRGDVNSAPTECYVIVANGPDLYLGANVPRVRIRPAEVSSLKNLLKTRGKPLKAYEERVVAAGAKARLALAIASIEVRKTASPDGPPLKTLAPSGAARLRLLELAADERTPSLTCSLRLDVKIADGDLFVLYANPKYGHFDGPIEFRGRRWVVENQAELLGLVGQSHGKVPAK